MSVYESNLKIYTSENQMNMMKIMSDVSNICNFLMNICIYLFYFFAPWNIKREQKI